ncbi:MAG: hypothetical protein QF489_07380 [Planctomycetota bacterium]|jgi:hypothetical protein|nr:hypothetical protein [Planctomycetota bacterium]
MDKKELRRKMAVEAAAKDKKRLILAIGGLILCIAVLFMLNKKANEAGDRIVDQKREAAAAFTELLPKLDYSILDKVKDKTDSDRVILEPDAFRMLSEKSQEMINSWFNVLGKEFDFLTGREKAPELRGGLFRLRGELIDARPLTRVEGEEPEYWCQIRTDDGAEFFYVSVLMPTELFVHDNFVLADGYFFKYYRQKVDGDWITLPLFVGRQLVPSWPRAEPRSEPDMAYLAGVRDQPIGTHNDVEQLNTRPELWHLANVARTVAATPESLAEAIKEPLVMDWDLLKLVSESPEIYRGRMFQIGGIIRGTPATVRATENPLRETQISSAWIRNDSVGDVLLHLKAPGEFPFSEAGLKPTVYHGYFLMLWAYHDSQEIPRRSPVFVVVDSFSPEPYTPPFAGQMVLMFLGIAVAIGFLLLWLVRKDRRNSEIAMQKMLDRRNNRRD